MKLAIPYEEGQIFQHFGKTPAFKIYDIANGQVADPDALCHHHDGGHTCGHHGEGHSCGGSCH